MLQIRLFLVAFMLLRTVSFRFIQPIKRYAVLSKMTTFKMKGDHYPQSLDFTSILRTVSELQYLKPSKVENIFQEDACSLYIALRTDQLHWIHINWNSKFSWIALAQSPTRSKTHRLSLESTLTSFLQDMYLTDLSIPDERNRVVRLGFSDKIAQSPKYNLFVEIMGAKANIALVDARSSLILACGYQVAAGRSKGGRETNSDTSMPTKQRVLQISGKYEPPPVFTFDEDLSNLSDLTRKLTEGTMSYYGAYSVLLRSSPAISPNIVHSILRAVNLESSSSTKSTTQYLSDPQIRSIVDIYSLWNASYWNGIPPNTMPSVTQCGFQIQPTPHVFQVTDRDGSQKSFYSPIQFTQDPITSPKPNPTRLVDFLKEHYAIAYRAYLFSSLRTECDRALSKRLDKADRLLSKLEAMERERTYV